VLNRSTVSTVWERSVVVDCAVNGWVLVLDGIDHARSDVLSVLHSLAYSRTATLPDGTRLVPRRVYEAWGRPDGVLPVSEAFRMIAIATPPTRENRWITPETTAMFAWHSIEPPGREETRVIVDGAVARSLVAPAGARGGEMAPGAEAAISRLLDVARVLDEAAEDSALPTVSLRLALRLAHRIARFPDDLHGALHRSCLSEFMPAHIAEAFDGVLEECGVVAPPSGGSASVDDRGESQPAAQQPASNTPMDGGAEVNIHGVWLRAHTPTHPSLVPTTAFHATPAHSRALADIARDLALGERHLLLIGNQGTGKNKLIDHLLWRLGREREYVQLHRDATVHALTAEPRVGSEGIVHVDSPVVRAIKLGRALVVDEADKARVEVVRAVKGLVQDGVMRLADGRVVVDSTRARTVDRSGLLGEGEEYEVIDVHPDFVMFVLANRPGFPFLGSDLFRELGDSLSTHVISNPEIDSEIELLRFHADRISTDSGKVCG
jgi:MoxR-like ATPase